VRQPAGPGGARQGRERILEGLLTDAGRRLREEGIPGDIYLFKNNTDSAGNSYGCHENYLVDRHGDVGRLTDSLTPFLVTRQIICGAGKVLQTPQGALYCVSQRADHIWDVASSAGNRSRAVISTADKPHADAARYRRLRVTVGDSNMSETETSPAPTGWTRSPGGCWRCGSGYSGRSRPGTWTPSPGRSTG
jgi:proteasome accessory factor A